MKTRFEIVRQDNGDRKFLIWDNIEKDYIKDGYGDNAVYEYDGAKDVCKELNAENEHIKEKNMYILISDTQGDGIVRGYFNTIAEAKEYAHNECFQDIAIYLLASDINFAEYDCKGGGLIYENYFDLVYAG